MNLHNARFSTSRVAMWLRAYGQNGREIGTHLWVIEEGAPDDTVVETAQAWNRTYWMPRRLQWRAFDYRNLFNNGYVQPLCGHRSASRWPRVAEGGYFNNNACANCTAEASRRGMVAMTATQATEQSRTMQELLVERQAFIDAGRPNTWPVQTT